MVFDNAVDKLENHADVFSEIEEQLERIGDMVKSIMERLRPK